MAEQQYFPSRERWFKHSPEQDVLSDFIANSLNHFLLADTDVTINAMRRYTNAVLCFVYPLPQADVYVPFNDIAKRADDRVGALRQSYADAHPEEYSKMTSNTDPQAYFDGLSKNVPESEPLARIACFFGEYYRGLDKNLRIAAALAFLGLLFTVLHDPAFASFCKAQDLDVAVMTLEQKANEPIDPEALYSYLQAKLDGVLH